MLCLGGVTVAALAGTRSASLGPMLGPPVVVGSTSPHPTGPTLPTGGDPERSGHEDDGTPGPQVVGPAPVHDVDDDDTGSTSGRGHG